MKLVDRYLAGFPYLSLPDPEGYQTALTEVMQRYPQWAGEYAIKQANPDNPNLPVSDIVLRKWLESLVRPHRAAQAWDKHSTDQIEERKLIEGPAQTKQTYDEFRQEMAMRGMPINGGGKRSRELDPLPEETMAKLGLSKDQWDALPDTPPSDHWEQLCAKHRM